MTGAARAYSSLSSQQDTLHVVSDTPEQDISRKRDGIIEGYHREINQFLHLDPQYKDWAKDELKEEIQKGGINPLELMEKYKFYDQMAQIRNDSLSNLPQHKRQQVHHIIDAMLNESTHGQGRGIKQERMQHIKRICHEYTTNKSLLRFTLARYEGKYEQRVYEVLFSDEKKEFQTYYEKVFTKDFWKVFNTMHPREFPHLSGSFIYFSPVDMLGNMDMKQLKSIAPKLKKAIIEDCEELLDTFASPKDKKTFLKDVESITDKNPAKLLSKLRTLKIKQEKQQASAEKEWKNIHHVFRRGHLSQSHKMLQNFIQIYGADSFGPLGASTQVKQIQYRFSQLEKFKHLLNTTTDKEKKQKLIQKIEELDNEATNINALDTKDMAKQRRIDPLLKEINAKRKQGTVQSLKSAHKIALKLKSIDSKQGQKELQQIDDALTRKQSELKGETQQDGAHEHLGLEKKKKIEFIDRCIEHAEKVKEKCDELGIPKDNPDFWSPEGCKNRQQWLQDKQLWNPYRKYNDNDKNMPKKQGTSTFRFRWLDLRTGSNLSGAKAEQGIKYLDRYKDSGYEVAALAAGFSVDWRSNSSPSYNPDQFISLCNEEKKRIIGE